MAILTFEELYISICENCGADIENWEWFEEDMVFRTPCGCGCEYTLEPTMGVLLCETDTDEEDDDDE